MNKFALIAAAVAVLATAPAMARGHRPAKIPPQDNEAMSYGPPVTYGAYAWAPQYGYVAARAPSWQRSRTAYGSEIVNVPMSSPD